jgi:membrane-associated protein
LWGAGVTLAGYVLGETIPDVDTYLLPIIVLIVVVSAIPVGIEVLRARRANRTNSG